MSTHQPHCLWDNLEQRVRRVPVGEGFNIFFNYTSCPHGPDPSDMSCVRKGLRGDNLHFHPCCSQQGTSLPHCQQLERGAVAPVMYNIGDPINVGFRLLERLSRPIFTVSMTQTGQIG